MSEPTQRPDDNPTSETADPYAGLEQPRRRDFRKEIRSIGELTRLAASGKRLLREGTRGNYELVVVYPGFGAGDSATALLRSYLTNRGFSTRGWRLGRNHGDVEKLLPQVIARLEYEIKHFGAPIVSDDPALREETAEREDKAERKETAEREEVASLNKPPVKAHLVGWSLGGYIAREIARDRPDLVEQVITFGTPVVGGPKYTASAAAYRDRGVDVDAIEAMVAERNTRPLQVPVLAIFSKTDGVVNWRACIDHFSDDVEHIEIDSAHTGMPINPDIFELVASRLAGETPTNETTETLATADVDKADEYAEDTADLESTAAGRADDAVADDAE